MRVTNRCTSPTSTITLRANAWRPITTVPSVMGMNYWVSVYVNVTGGTIRIEGTNADISKSQRIHYSMVINNTGPVSMCYRVKSGSPTVTVTDMLLCSFDEYQANKAVLDSLQYFTGDTMPLA